MNITENFIHFSVNRPATQLKKVYGFVIHYVGCACTHAEIIRNNFDRADRIGSTQFIIDYDTGEIIQTMPETERAQQVGSAQEELYTNIKRSICGNNNPNNYFIGVECCVPGVYYDSDMKPSKEQYNSLIELSAYICKKYNLNPLTQIFTHTDIASTKECHKYYVRHPQEFKELKQDVYINIHYKEDEEMIIYKTLADVPEWGQPTIAKLITTGDIKGDESGNINLEYVLVRTLVILDRRGKL